MFLQTNFTLNIQKTWTPGHIKKLRLPTHGIVHAGFRGFARFVARKKSNCKLIGIRFAIPHDIIPSNVVGNCSGSTYKK